MELVRYRPGEAIRWLQSGAESIRLKAKKKGASLIRREGERSIGKDVAQAAGALLEGGKSAIADLLHKRAQATEYVLDEAAFEVLAPGGARKVAYDEVTSIRMEGDKATLVLKKGSLSIKPYAYIVAGRIRVPIGWGRNGMEVPYELLIEELAARCGVEVDEA